MAIFGKRITMNTYITLYPSFFGGLVYLILCTLSHSFSENMTRQDYRSYLRADVEIVPKLENKENVYVQYM